MATAYTDALPSLPSFDRPTIIPDDGLLAYWWMVDGETSLRLYDPEMDAIDTVAIDSTVFSPDGWEPIHWVDDRFFIQSHPDIYVLDRAGNIDDVPLEDEHTRVVDIDATARRYLYVYYPDGVGLSDAPWTLRLYDSAADTTTTLTEHPEQWGHAGFSPDNQWIAYRENPTESFGGDQLVITDIDGTQEHTVQIGDATARTRLYDWHPDSQRLLLDDRSSGWYRVGLYNWHTTETTWVGEGQYNEFPLTILPDGERIITTRFCNGLSTAIVYPTTDAAGRTLDLADGVVDRRTHQAIGTTLKPDHVVLKHETATRPPRLLNYNLVTDEVTTLVDTQTEVLQELPLTEADHVTYDTTDGLAVNAVLHRASPSPSPAIVNVHGGPTTAVHRGFDPFAQYFVNNGYTVLQPNYRGSTDQDRAFEAAIRGDSGQGAVDDVAEGARWLAGRDWIDADRLAVVGHSAGAYNAAMQAIRHPDLWQVVIPENGMLDRVATLTNPNQYAQRRLIDDPAIETEEDYLRKRSPIHRTDDIGCACCIIHGEHDAGVEVSQEFVDELNKQGWTEGREFRCEIIEGEGHVIDDKQQLWSLISERLNEYISDE